ncbi:MAG: mechanosensitive ion channel family protein [Persephonella sp.]|nr:MAG: mechanosensitive ion channel family protein [Persephonella sp.]
MDRLLKLLDKDLALFFEQPIFGISLYKWILALSVFLLFLFLRKIFTYFVIKLLRQAVRKTKTKLDDKILKLLIAPTRYLFIVLGIWSAINILGLKGEIVRHFIKSLLIVAVFWAFYNAVNIFKAEIYKFSAKFGKELSQEIGNFLIKTLKALVVVLSVVAVLQEWGINVSAFVASLGLGGLAFALAAKDTVANLFGGLTILADKSMKLGDWVKIGSVEGIVEDIGLRTSKIRTFEKSLITVPNSYIANNPIENFSRRQNRRIKMYIGLTYDTPVKIISKIVEEIRYMLIRHPRIDKNRTLLVYFDEFGESSLNIFVYTFTDTADWEEYLAIKQDVMLKIMEIVEKNGSSFAFPSESIYIEKFPELPNGFKIET